MRYRTILSIVLAVGLIRAGTAPARAAATTNPRAPALVPFTITDHVDFGSDVSTFTATGPLCPKGTFVDDAVRIPAGHPDSSGQINLLNRTVYTCADGSTFNALRQTFITIAPDGSFTSTGPIQLLGGTGAFTDLTGHGLDNATSVNDGNGVTGQISGFVVQR